MTAVAKQSTPIVGIEYSTGEMIFSLFFSGTREMHKFPQKYYYTYYNISLYSMTFIHREMFLSFYTGAVAACRFNSTVTRVQIPLENGIEISLRPSVTL